MNKQFFIGQVYISGPNNKKCDELREYVRQFTQTLIPNEEAAQDLVAKLRQHAEELNAKYPRTKPLEVRELHGQVYCNFNYDTSVFSFTINEVKHHYSLNGLMERYPDPETFIDFCREQGFDQFVIYATSSTKNGYYFMPAQAHTGLEYGKWHGYSNDFKKGGRQ